VPVKSIITGKLQPVKISAGRYYSAFLTNEGELYTFGNNGYSRAGHPLICGEVIKIPTLVKSVKNVVSVF